MPEPNYAEQSSNDTEQKWAGYNGAMRRLFAERDTHPIDSPERTAVAEKIRTLWVSEGS